MWMRVQGLRRRGEMHAPDGRWPLRADLHGDLPASSFDWAGSYLRLSGLMRFDFLPCWRVEDFGIQQSGQKAKRAQVGNHGSKLLP